MSNTWGINEAHLWVIPEGNGEREDTPNEGSTMHWGPLLKRKEKSVEHRHSSLSTS